MCRRSSYTDHKYYSDHRKHASSKKYRGHKERCHWDGYSSHKRYSSCDKYSEFRCFPDFGDPGPVIPQPIDPNLIQNGGMELPAAFGTAPRFWSITGAGTRTGFSTLANTGQYAVFLSNGATLSQVIPNIIPGRQYRFSFYATYGLNQNGGRGLPAGTVIQLNVNIYYVLMGTPVSLFSTQLNPNNTYDYIASNLPAIPAGISTLIVQFTATNGTAVPGLPTDVGVLIDDVALVKTSL